MLELFFRKTSRTTTGSPNRMCTELGRCILMRHYLKWHNKDTRWFIIYTPIGALSWPPFPIELIRIEVTFWDEPINMSAQGDSPVSWITKHNSVCISQCHKEKEKKYLNIPMSSLSKKTFSYTFISLHHHLVISFATQLNQRATESRKPQKEKQINLLLLSVRGLMSYLNCTR